MYYLTQGGSCACGTWMKLRQPSLSSIRFSSSPSEFIPLSSSKFFPPFPMVGLPKKNFVERKLRVTRGMTNKSQSSLPNLGTDWLKVAIWLTFKAILNILVQQLSRILFSFGHGPSLCSIEKNRLDQCYKQSDLNLSSQIRLPKLLKLVTSSPGFSGSDVIFRAINSCTKIQKIIHSDFTFKSLIATAINLVLDSFILRPTLAATSSTV